MTVTDSQCEQQSERVYKNHLQSCTILVADETHPSHDLNFGIFPEGFFLAHYKAMVSIEIF